jgi:cytochrome c oxidase subunit I+III
VGPDPWHGPTLEWATSSPPPAYNFAVIPKVSSAYPNWDDADREEDRRRLAEGVLVLDEGNEQVETTPADAYPSVIVEMPHESPWPVLLALAMGLVFTALVIQRYGVAFVMLVVCGLVLVGWHSKEPQQA